MLSPHVVESATAWRRQIHRLPELGFQEEETAALVVELCESFGLDVTSRIGGTGVVASVSRGTGTRVVGLRADMDALPIVERGTVAHRSVNDGVFHGCGHDGHTAMLLGAAKVLAESNDFDGTCRFIFQPCEETGLGAQAMIDDGLFEDFPVDAVYGLHNMPGIAAGHFGIRSGPLMSFEDTFEIAIEGRGGHASMPNRTVDAIVVGAEIVGALQTIVARSVDPIETAVVSVTEFVTDGARNIIASNVTIRGDCRGFTDEVGDRIETRMRAIIDGLAIAHQAKATLRYQREFVVLNNTPSETEQAVAAAIVAVGSGRVDSHTPPIPASEDFARMLAVKPGCYALIGNGGDPETSCSLHNPSYDFNDDIIAAGVDYWVALAKSLLAPRLAEPGLSSGAS